MNDETDDDFEPLQLFADKLVSFRAVWYDHRRPAYGYTLSGIYTHVEPPPGFTFPFRIPKVFIYFQVWGDIGEYRFRIRLVRLSPPNEDNETEDVQLGRHGEPREFPIPTLRPVEVTGLNYVDEIPFFLENVPFDTPGIYEYQLWAEGIDRPIARERIQARE
jgi:hypothetical protein